MSAVKAAARWAVRRAARPRQWCLIGSGAPCPHGTKTRGFRRASVSPPCASVLIARPATSSRPAPAATHSSLRMNQRFFFRARVDPMIGGSSVSSLSMRRRLCTLPFLPPLGIAGRGEGRGGALAFRNLPLRDVNRRGKELAQKRHRGGRQKTCFTGMDNRN